MISICLKNTSSLLVIAVLLFAFGPDTHGQNVDFNNDGYVDIVDADILWCLAGDISQPTGEPVPKFLDFLDLDGDGHFTVVDRNLFLLLAGLYNGYGTSYLLGDGNLDGCVDGTDWGLWNANKFTDSCLLSDGDFNGDGVVDVSDWGLWNSNKFTCIDPCPPCVGGEGK